MVLMYFASTLYHALPQGKAKRVFRRLKHGAIFLLIAGTYTPFTLVTLRGTWGWTLFGRVWSLAFLRILIKGVATTKHRGLPGVLYLGMSWLIISAVRPLTQSLPPRRTNVAAVGRNRLHGGNGILRSEVYPPLPLRMASFCARGHHLPLLHRLVLCRLRAPRFEICQFDLRSLFWFILAVAVVGV